MRRFVTPDAFSVHPALIGLPLARPSRRLAAMALDLFFVAILAHTGGFALLLVAAAYVSIRLAAKLVGEGRGIFSRAVRLSMRALGALVLFLVAVNGLGTVRDVVRGEAPSAPRQAPARAERSAGPAERAADPDSLALAYAAARAAGDDHAALALAPLVGSAFARDSLDALQSRLERERRQSASLAARIEEESSARLIARIVDFFDELGIGLGWSGLYFTAFVVLWKGQTPGKRLLGMRVVRLNGEPMTLWMSFERFGGYAAGLFTGLLGYAQVYWDHNRQAIHDKIVETVVVRERRGTAPYRPPVAEPPSTRRRAPLR